MSQPTNQASLVPYLTITPAAEAIEFYKRAFGFVENMRMDMPGGKIGHAALDLPDGGEGGIYLSDESGMQGMPKSPRSLGGSTTTVHLISPDVDAAFKRAVDAGATALMPPTDMFWGDRYARVLDPFGHHWSIATHKEQLTPEQMKQRGDAAMRQHGAK